MLLLIVFLLLLLSGGVDPPDPPVHPSPKNHSVIISKIATPILALSKDDIRVLMYMGNNLRNTLGHQGNLQLTPELQREFVDLTDSSEILKMFWIIKVAPPRLYNLTKSNWDFIAVDPGTRLLQLVTFSNEDKIEISHFDNLDLVVNFISWYREEVFHSMVVKATKPFVDSVLPVSPGSTSITKTTPPSPDGQKGEDNLNHALNGNDRNPDGDFDPYGAFQGGNGLDDNGFDLTQGDAIQGDEHPDSIPNGDEDLEGNEIKSGNPGEDPNPNLLDAKKKIDQSLLKGTYSIECSCSYYYFFTTLSKMCECDRHTLTYVQDGPCMLLAWIYSQPASTQCGVGPVCVPIELLSTYFNLPQPSVVLVQCVSP